MRGWVGTAVACCLVIWFGAGAAMACTLPDLRTDIAPRPKDDGPVRVTAAFLVNDILGVDDVNQSLDVDIGASLRWRDPRLAGLDGCRFARTQVWMPDIVLQNSSNLRNARSNMRDQVVIGPQGEVRY